MARITMRKVQETKLSEVFTLYLASAAARGVKDKTLRTYEQHFKAISKRLDVDGNISQITSKDLDKMILKMREDGFSIMSTYLFGLSSLAAKARYRAYPPAISVSKTPETICRLGVITASLAKALSPLKTLCTMMQGIRLLVLQ